MASASVAKGFGLIELSRSLARSIWSTASDDQSRNWLFSRGYACRTRRPRGRSRCVRITRNETPMRRNQLRRPFSKNIYSDRVFEEIKIQDSYANSFLLMIGFSVGEKKILSGRENQIGYRKNIYFPHFDKTRLFALLAKIASGGNSPI